MENLINKFKNKYKISLSMNSNNSKGSEGQKSEDENKNESENKGNLKRNDSFRRFLANQSLEDEKRQKRKKF